MSCCVSMSDMHKSSNILCTGQKMEEEGQGNTEEEGKEEADEDKHV